MDRRVTPPKRVTSPPWGPPLPCGGQYLTTKKDHPKKLKWGKGSLTSRNWFVCCCCWCAVWAVSGRWDKRICGDQNQRVEFKGSVCKNRSRAIEVSRLHKNYMKNDHRNYRRNFLITGIVEVKVWNPVQAWIFSGFLFETLKVASITAMIFFHIILHPAVLIYDFHIFL